MIEKTPLDKNATHAAWWGCGTQDLDSWTGGTLSSTCGYECTYLIIFSNFVNSYR